MQQVQHLASAVGLPGAAMASVLRAVLQYAAIGLVLAALGAFLFYPASKIMTYEAFLVAHPRQPHPTRISWETERTDRYNRFRWLVIDRLGSHAASSTRKARKSARSLRASSLLT